MKEIPLTRGKFALVDDEDFERLIKFKWATFKHPESDHLYYAFRRRLIWENGENSIVWMNRFIMGVDDGRKVHHKNGNGLDNQKENLRILDSNSTHRGIHRIINLHRFLRKNNIEPKDFEQISNITH